MESIIKIIADYGISIVCVGYLMYFQIVTMRDIMKIMQETVTGLNNVNERLMDIEKVLDKKKAGK